eukprot:TRINITY_DN6334_c1_g1_i1.p1 TRINITY_DN6334_c1_g1~~TRINITY_DN6334_c1_g1_i1.p1  ORF type:complete len:263 (+),score=48.00 TRINITY_DN6334_c1_g1_i1:76-864(+)
MPRTPFVPQATDFNIFSGQPHNASDSRPASNQSPERPMRPSVAASFHSPLWVGSATKFHTSNVMGQHSASPVAEHWENHAVPEVVTTSTRTTIVPMARVRTGRRANPLRQQSTINPLTGGPLSRVRSFDSDSDSDAGSDAESEPEPVARKALSGTQHTPLFVGRSHWKTSNVMSQHNPHVHEHIWDPHHHKRTEAELTASAKLARQERSITRPKNGVSSRLYPGASNGGTPSSDSGTPMGKSGKTRNTQLAVNEQTLRFERR